MCTLSVFFMSIFRRALRRKSSSKMPTFGGFASSNFLTPASFLPLDEDSSVPNSYPSPLSVRLKQRWISSRFSP